MKKHQNNNWWDGQQTDTFFPAVYRSGDDSIEGHLDDLQFTPEQRTIRECDLIESILTINAGAKILDCPCGYGRHSIELARRGYNVTGVDLCPQFIAEAKQSARTLPPEAKCRFIEGDMRSLPDSLGIFDVCVNMFFSFGFFEDEDNLRVLREYHNVLKPGGRLLVHTDVNPDRVENGQYGDRSLRKLRSGGQLTIQERYEAETRRLEGIWIINQGNAKPVIKSYSVRIYSHVEMEHILKEAGFSRIEIRYPNSTTEYKDDLPQEVFYVATR